MYVCAFKCSGELLMSAAMTVAATKQWDVHVCTCMYVRMIKLCVKMVRQTSEIGKCCQHGNFLPDACTIPTFQNLHSTKAASMASEG